MKLYYNPQSRAVIAKWMLDECGLAYEIVPIDLQKREHKAAEFLKINPALLPGPEARLAPTTFDAWLAAQTATAPRR